jgi:hypothetical protein
MYEPVLNGETWAIDFFFEILNNVPMQRNFYKLVEILNTDNKKVYEKTIDFLKKLTKLRIKARFNDTNEKKGEAKQAFGSWFQKHVQNLK